MNKIYSLGPSVKSVSRGIKTSSEVDIARFGGGRICMAVFLFLFFGSCQSLETATYGEIDSQGRIQPYEKNPHYLAWGEVPVFLLGAAEYHSWTPVSRPGTAGFIEQMERLFEVVEEIDSPHLVGFMRALPYDPMNHLHDGPVERVLQPWVRSEDDLYDLEYFEPEWEERFKDFLDAALEREIVVAVELWDDWSVTRGPGGEYDPGEGAAWNAHPFNPNNNINFEEDVLPVETSACDAPFYHTVSSNEGMEEVLKLQKVYVDKILEIISNYTNVMINISNESRASLDWSRFWAEYVSERVPEEILIGEMPSTNRRDGGGECEEDFNPLTLSTDPNYSYVDVSQGVSGHEFEDVQEQASGGGQRLREYRQAMQDSGTIRPLIISKDYTRDSDGGDITLWSRFIGGAASARFHRLGVDHDPEVSDFQHEAVKRLGAFIAEIPFWEMHPATDLLDDLPENTEVNVLSSTSGHIIIQLIGENSGESFSADLEPGAWTVRWMDPSQGTVMDQFEISVDTTPFQFDIPEGPEHKILYLKQ